MQLCTACVHLGMARLYSFTHLNVATSFQSKILQPAIHASKRKQTGPQGMKNCSDYTHRHSVSWIDFCRCFGVDSPLHGVESSLWVTTAHEQKTKTLVSSAHTGFTSFTSTHVNMPQQQLSISRRVQIFVLKKLLGFKFPISNMTQQFRIKHNITMGICGQFYHYKIFLG